MRVRGFIGILGVSLLVAAGLAAAGPVSAAPAPKRCAVQSGRAPQTAKPEEAGFDPAALAEAINFAAGRNRLTVQVFRHNCLVAHGPGDEGNAKLATNGFSITKSVVSLIAGIAYDEGKLELRAPIGKYLPAGLGDAAHRAITVEHLLTETAGLQQSAGAEGITGLLGVDPNSAVQALGLPLVTPPGAEFSYSQRVVDLLTFTVEKAAGERFQDYAQRKLFDPLGIPRSDYLWRTDRSGNTYGYAHLMMPADNLSKLGLLMLNQGKWGTKTVISQRYLAMAVRPSPKERCYGYLFWLGGPGCGGGHGFPEFYLMSGLGLQNVFVFPSLGLTFTWTGVFGNTSKDGVLGILESQGELSHNFIRKLYAALRDPRVPDPGAYREPPLVDKRSFVQEDITLAALGIGPGAYPGCTVLACMQAALRPPNADLPPGCTMLVCLGPDPRTPGIR